jgi:DNA modification methylase
MDTVSILKYAQTAYPNMAEVDVDASADMVDMYGRTSVDQVATLTYSRATLDKIDWNNFDFKNIWNIPIADSAEVHPAFQY